MKIVISTQFKENYGAHDWDGTGECPQYWKFKGGSEYIIDNVEEHITLNEMFGKKCEMVVDSISWKIEHSSDYAEEYILDWSIEEDDYMSEFEKSQLEYDGEIKYAEPRLTIDGDLIPRSREAA
jgi:hypothetical protein